ncbi:MAG TPA: Crp/Fnr family transcriptional regulator [Candidatus Sulfotelmatobacter sp.]|nr:Crp/Fnr family transcriptional regulator [Candidatus Sulfotelmatobacter sp.]
MPAAARVSGKGEKFFGSEARRREAFGREEMWPAGLPTFEPKAELPNDQVRKQAASDINGHLYLISCQAEWERTADPSAAWEIISATRSSDSDLRAHALCLLERLQQIRPTSPNEISPGQEYQQTFPMEAGMRTPYGLEIIESCMGCKVSQPGFFCHLSPEVLRNADLVSHHTVMPAGAILFVEGQTPRGIFIVCHGSVKLSTTSKEGKVLILKQAEAGEVLGLSAVISGTNYEMTVETASPCQLNFIGRRDFMGLLQRESEVGMHAALWLSHEFQSAYRDIHDLVLARSSSGKLARLLLSCAPVAVKHADELHLRAAMTHEEMAQRIGSSRETVTRLLSELKKKRLIRLEGATLVIRDRGGLEALAV